MATRAALVDRTADGTVRVTWTGLLSGDDGAPVDYAAHSDRSAQVTGVFGVAGNVRLQGSLEAIATNWATLSDPQGNVLDFGAAKIEAVMETTSWVRPLVTAGDGTTSLTVTMVLRRR